MSDWWETGNEWQDPQNRSGGWWTNDEWHGWQHDRSGGGWQHNHSGEEQAVEHPVMAEGWPAWAAVPAQDIPVAAAVAAEARPTEDRPAEDRPLRVYDEEFFLTYNTFTGGYRQHNAALKYWRALKERTGDPFGSPPVDLLVDSRVCEVQHEAKGMDYAIQWQTERPWSWLEMVAQLTDESIASVVKGNEGRSGGLVGCSFAPRPGSYDHKRHHQLKAKGENPNTKLPIWDFVLHRDDGSAIRLHPQWSNTKVETYSVEGHAVDVEPPQRGLGASDGRGTYKFYKTRGSAELLRFDGKKRLEAGRNAAASSNQGY